MKLRAQARRTREAKMLQAAIELHVARGLKAIADDALAEMLEGREPTRPDSTGVRALDVGEPVNGFDVGEYVPSRAVLDSIALLTGPLRMTERELIEAGYSAGRALAAQDKAKGAQVQ